MAYKVDKLPDHIDIGITGTNKQNIIDFDVSAWKTLCPSSAAVYSVMLRRPNEPEEDAYYGNAEMVEGTDILRWTVGYSDVEIEGNGLLEIHLYEIPELLLSGEVDYNKVYARSKSVMTRITRAIAPIGSEIPEPMEPFTVRIEEAAESAVQAKEAAIAAAAQAEEAVEHYPYIGENGNWWVWDSETEAFVDTGDPARGDDAPKIDDTQASADHPWSGEKISEELSDKADLTQVVRYDATQSLTEAQKSQAQRNAGIWTGTQAEYDAIATKGANTIYMIVEATT